MMKNIVYSLFSCSLSSFIYAVDSLDTRINNHTNLSSQFITLNEHELRGILAQSSATKKGWGETCRININGTDVFVKKIPLTDRERLPENYRSTANLFNIPLFYQYGVGSAGFGARREFESHLITTNWVKTKKCGNFPMLYHWCVMEEEKPESMTQEQRARLEDRVTYWEGADEIRNRLVSIHDSSAYIVLFIEYFPQNLHTWLPIQINEGGETAKEAVEMVMSNLKTTIDHMRAHEFIHFDVHFHNILTDGKQLYFTDFGLSLTKTFTLSPEENNFFYRA